MTRSCRSLLALILTAALPAAALAAPTETVELTLSGGRRIALNLKRTPGAAPADRLPAMLMFGGFQNAAKVLDLVEPERPVVLASFDYPFDPPRKFRFPSSLSLLPDAKRMIHDTREGIRLAAAHLRSRADVDPERISILGASLGAPFALLAASDDPGIRGVVVVHGFGDPARTIAHQFQRGWEPRFGAWTRPIAWALGQLAWAYASLPAPEESVQGLIHSQKLLVVSAAQDSFIPAEARTALLTAARNSGAGEVTLLETPGDHLQPGKRKLLSELLAKVTEWLSARGLL